MDEAPPPSPPEDGIKTSMGSPLISFEGKGIPWKIYASRALSAWGDRIWDFAGGLFIMDLYPSSLRLVAIYGFVKALSVIFFGAAIGNWIDRSARLTSAKVFLSIQNVAVAVCCVVFAAYFWKEDWFLGLGDWTTLVVAVIIIVVADVANLASLGSKIVVEKDWIVVIAGDDQSRLAQMNAVFRTIDLTALILSPMLAGILLDFVSNAFGAIFIAGWNVISVFFEFALLILIYRENPDLAKKHGVTTAEDKKESLAQKAKRSVESWSLFYNHRIRNAGIGLGCLYM